MTNAERQRRYRAKLTEDQGAVITVALTPKSAANLAAWVARGETVTAVVNRLLSRSAPRKP